MQNFKAKFKADIDIDFKTGVDPRDAFPQWTKASIIRDERITPHASGVYPQAISIDPISGLSAIHYEDAEELGFFKLDMLRREVYTHFQTRDEITELLEMEPDWDLLLVKENVEKLDQLSRHFDLVLKLRPRSIEDLADAIALIRPGKSKLILLYLAQKEMVREILYKKSDEFYFKKSHSYAYALIIVLQLHLISLGLL